ncbi:BamA/TamA family outer membrane protein [Geobacter sulfurreducens]|uniref:BamA/TamA family outer membrane protein n=1 Tax=Geobacter sulfurreducens TaxID=35554 RepID=UPI000DBB7EA9|nr:BamA/TamA family outer membrane protein [Geobacter sulfurreducens]BBA68910.1 Outer membrane protein assembly factor BamA [Geobacter sulfurreducens]
MGLRTVLLFAAFLVLTGCTTMVPRERLPYPLTDDSFGDPVKVVTIPLPVIATSPNEGAILGGLTAFLLHNTRDEVNTLIAPQVNYNQNFGTTFSLYGAFFPLPERNWEFNLSKSTNVNEDYEVRLRDKTFLSLNGKPLETNAFLYYFTDGSSRFYGFESGSLQQDETNYANREYGITMGVGYDLTDHLQLVLGERFRKVDIRPGAVSKVPYIRDRFTTAEVPGINGFTAHAQKIALIYNTLDDRTMPTGGLYARASIEGSAELLGSDAGYRHYEVELKGYFPLDTARYITVVRIAYNQTLGSEVPFLERSILGGETTLRGYGRNRFVDSSYLLCNLEERIRLFRWSVFDVNTDWEVAPFLDLGAVMDSLDRAEAKSFEFNPGIGFRAVVRPNIVGRVDIGFGNEGPAVFVGLGYPF